MTIKTEKFYNSWIMIEIRVIFGIMKLHDEIYYVTIPRLCVGGSNRSRLFFLDQWN